MLINESNIDVTLIGRVLVTPLGGQETYSKGGSKGLFSVSFSLLHSGPGLEVGGNAHTKTCSL